jgi:multimeric flavodoxin WrbA
MMNFIDRWRAIYPKMVNFQKVTGFITIGGSNRAGQEFAMMTLMRKLCVHGRLIFAPTATFEVVGGGLMTSRIHDPNHKFTSGKDGVMQDELGKAALRTMVEDVLILAKIIKTGRNQLGIPGPISAHRVR